MLYDLIVKNININDILRRELKHNAKIIIFGIDNHAIFLKDILQTQRQDVEILCFADFYIQDYINGIKVINCAEIINYDFDEIIITNFAIKKDIIEFLVTLRIGNIIDIDQVLFKRVINCTREGLIGYNPDNFKKTSEYFQANLDKLQKVKDILMTEEDKTLYEKLFLQRIDIDLFKKNYIDYLQQNNFMKKDIFNHYFHFLNREAIETIVEAGVYDGFNTSSFLGKMPNIKKIYAFDPFTKCIKPHYKFFIEKSNKVELNEICLSDKKGEISLQEFGEGSNIFSGNLYGQQITYKRPTISLEEFIKDNNINRKIDYIKTDVEGAEQLLLKGAENILIKDRPQMAISIYHTNYSLGDFFEIPLYLNSILDNYNFRLKHYSAYWSESVFYAIPKEVYKKDCFC